MMDADDESEDDASVHSALSRASDVEEEDEVDYLMLELIPLIPPDLCNRLMKNLRAKERVVQDLHNEVRQLISSCETLLAENQSLTEQKQSLTERVKEADSVKAETKAAASTPAPGPVIDNSIFMKLERGKEETILKLQRDNECLTRQLLATDEARRRMEEELLFAQKEMKRSQQGRGRVEAPATHQDVLEEEERMYQQLQSESAGDIIKSKMKQQQNDIRQKVEAALQSLLTDDAKLIERWSSDVSAMMLAVDGVESQVKQSAKDAKLPKKGAKPSPPSRDTTSVSPICQDAIAALETLLDEFDQVKFRLETDEQVQISLEQTVRGVHEETDAVLTAAGTDQSLAAAEHEAELIREQSARWVDHVQAISLKQTSGLLANTEKALRATLSDAPPGLVPPHVEHCLQDTCRQILELNVQLDGHERIIGEIVGEGMCLGRRAEALQHAHRAHRSELQNQLTGELSRVLGSLDSPVGQMRDGLRHQREALARAKSRTSGALDALATAAKRSAVSETCQGGGSVASNKGAGSDILTDALLGELREVRALGKTLAASLDEGAKTMEARVGRVLAATGSSKPNTTANNAVAASSSVHNAAVIEERKVAEQKRKKGKKKGRADAEPSAAPVASQAQSQQMRPALQKDTDRGNDDEDAKLREEFRRVCSDGVSTRVKKASGNGQPPSGQQLLQELKNLRSQSNRLQARIADRQRERARESSDKHDEDTKQDEDTKIDDTDAPRAAPPAAAARRRKKVFV